MDLWRLPHHQYHREQKYREIGDVSRPAIFATQPFADERRCKQDADKQHEPRDERNDERQLWQQPNGENQPYVVGHAEGRIRDSEEQAALGLADDRRLGQEPPVGQTPAA